VDAIPIEQTPSALLAALRADRDQYAGR